MSVKHKGDSWRWGWSKGKIRGEGRQGPKEKDSETSCRIVCLLIPFHCHLTLLSSPLLAVSDLSLSSSPLWSCPVLIPHSLPFVWQASTQEIITPPFSRRLIPFLDCLLHLQTCLHLFWSCLSCLLSVTINVVAVETGLFRNSRRKISAALLSILLLPCACGSTRACEGVRANFSANVRV